MLVDWHKDKLCSLCSIEFEGVDTDEEGLALGYDNRPALITPDGKLIEWMSLSVGKLCEALRTHKPVCWRCLVAETLRRKHRGAGVGQD